MTRLPLRLQSNVRQEEDQDILHNGAGGATLDALHALPVTHTSRADRGSPCAVLGRRDGD